MAGGGVPGGRSEGEQLELVRSLRKEWGEHKRSLADMLTLVDVASPRRAVEYERVRYHEIHVSDGGEDDLFHWNPAVKSSNTPPPPLPPPPPPPPASVPQHYFSNGSTPLRNVSPERQRSAERMASSGYWLESRRSLTPRLRSPWLRSSRPASPIGGTPPLQPAAVFERRAPPPPRPTSEPQGDLFTPHQHSPRPSPGPTPPLSPFPRDIATPDPGYAYTPSLRSAHGGRGQNVADPQPGGGADEDDDIFFDDQTFDPFQEDAPPASGVETPPMDALSFPSGTRRPSYQENGFDDERKAADLICSLSALELALDHAPIALQRRKQAGGGPNGATRHGTNPDLPQAKRPPFPLGAASDVSTAFDVPTATRSHRERGGSSTRKPMISPLPPQSVPAKDAPHTRASFAGAPQGPGKPRPVQRAAQPSQPPYVAAFDRTVPQPGGAGGRQGAPDAAAQQNAEFAGGAAATRQGAGASWTAANARKLPSQQQQQQLQQQQVQQQPPAAGFRVRSPPADASEPSGTAANARKLPSQQQQLQQQQLQQQQQQQQPPAAGFRVRSPPAEASEPGGNWAPSAVQCVPRAPPSARARDGQPAASNGNSTGPQQAPPQHLRTPLAQQQAAGEAADDSVSADPRHPLRTPPQRQERRGSHPEASFAEEPTANGAASAAAVPSTKTAAEPPPAKGAKRGPADEAPSESGTSEPQTARQTAAPGFKPAAWRTDTATETGSPVTTVRAGSGSPVSPGSGSPVKQPGQAPSRAQPSISPNEPKTAKNMLAGNGSLARSEPQSDATGKKGQRAERAITSMGRGRPVAAVSYSSGRGRGSAQHPPEQQAGTPSPRSSPRLRSLSPRRSSGTEFRIKAGKSGAPPQEKKVKLELKQGETPGLVFGTSLVLEQVLRRSPASRVALEEMIGMRLVYVDGEQVSDVDDVHERLQTPATDTVSWELGWTQTALVVTDTLPALEGLYLPDDLDYGDRHNLVRTKFSKVGSDAIIYYHLGLWKLHRFNRSTDWLFSSDHLTEQWTMVEGRDVNSNPSKYPTVSVAEELYVVLTKHPKEPLGLTFNGCVLTDARGRPGLAPFLNYQLIRVNRKSVTPNSNLQAVLGPASGNHSFELVFTAPTSVMSPSPSPRSSPRKRKSKRREQSPDRASDNDDKSESSHSSKDSSPSNKNKKRKKKQKQRQRGGGCCRVS